MNKQTENNTFPQTVYAGGISSRKEAKLTDFNVCGKILLGNYKMLHVKLDVSSTWNKREKSIYFTYKHSY